MQSKREIELELALWQERINSGQNGAAALQAQSQLLQISMKEARENIARLDAALKAVEVPPDAPEEQKAPAESPTPP